MVPATSKAAQAQSRAAGKKASTGRQRDDSKRQRPGELVGLDQKGRADPPEAGDKIAEAHPPAGAERRPKRTGERTSVAAIRRAVDEPNRDCQRYGDKDEDGERRQREGAKRA